MKTLRLFAAILVVCLIPNNSLRPQTVSLRQYSNPSSGSHFEGRVEGRADFCTANSIYLNGWLPADDASYVDSISIIDRGSLKEAKIYYPGSRIYTKDGSRITSKGILISGFIEGIITGREVLEMKFRVYTNREHTFSIHYYIAMTDVRSGNVVSTDPTSRSYEGKNEQGHFTYVKNQTHKGVVQSRKVSVDANIVGVKIAFSPSDNKSNNSGTTPFTSAFAKGTKITFTAPASVVGAAFDHFENNGAWISNENRVSITLGNDAALFAVYAKNLVISGIITGAAIAGVKIGFSGYANDVATDASGKYSMTVSWKYSGKILPSKTGYSFTPVSISVAGLTSDLSNQNFISTTLPVVARHSFSIVAPTVRQLYCVGKTVRPQTQSDVIPSTISYSVLRDTNMSPLATFSSSWTIDKYYGALFVKAEATFEDGQRLHAFVPIFAGSVDDSLEEGFIGTDLITPAAAAVQYYSFLISENVEYLGPYVQNAINRIDLNKLQWSTYEVEKWPNSFKSDWINIPNPRYRVSLRIQNLLYSKNGVSGRGFWPEMIIEDLTSKLRYHIRGMQLGEVEGLNTHHKFILDLFKPLGEKANGLGRAKIAGSGYVSIVSNVNPENQAGYIELLAHPKTFATELEVRTLNPQIGSGPLGSFVSVEDGFNAVKEFFSPSKSFRISSSKFISAAESFSMLAKGLTIIAGAITAYDVYVALKHADYSQAVCKPVAFGTTLWLASTVTFASCVPALGGTPAAYAGCVVGGAIILAVSSYAAETACTTAWDRVAVVIEKDTSVFTRKALEEVHDEVIARGYNASEAFHIQAVGKVGERRSLQLVLRDSSVVFEHVTGRRSYGEISYIGSISTDTLNFSLVIPRTANDVKLITGLVMSNVVVSGGTGTSVRGDTIVIKGNATTMEADPIPSEFGLLQNYPNPFNPSTTISFSIPSSGHLTLKVYTLLGKEVATLVDGIRAEGVHSLSFDATKLGFSSGLYIYRLDSQGTSASKKMLFLK